MAMITAQELRNHATTEHARGCDAAKPECTCGLDIRTERILRAAANHIDGLEIALRDMRERLALERENKP
jgi:hypothetical protein